MSVTRVVIQNEIILRVPLQPRPMFRDIEWVERKRARCIPIGQIRQAMMSGPVQVDFIMADHSRVRAHLDEDCPALDFYGSAYLQPEDDRLWAALVEAKVPLAIHVGLVDGPAEAKEKGKSTNGSLRIFDAPIRAVQFIEGGVFDRFPELAVVLVEVDSGWLPYVAEQMDDRFKRTRSVLKPDIKRNPSEYFFSNIYSTFITDSYGVRNRRDIGVSQMMWSSDYPHSGADWPNSWDTIRKHFAGVPDEEMQAILVGNAARLYPKR